jgi:hypothetical protein
MQMMLKQEKIAEALKLGTNAIARAMQLMEACEDGSKVVEEEGGEGNATKGNVKSTASNRTVPLLKMQRGLLVCHRCDPPPSLPPIFHH